MIGEFCFAVPHDTPAVNTGDEMGLHQLVVVNMGMVTWVT